MFTDQTDVIRFKVTVYSAGNSYALFLYFIYFFLARRKRPTISGYFVPVMTRATDPEFESVLSTSKQLIVQQVSDPPKAVSYTPTRFLQHWSLPPELLWPRLVGWWKRRFVTHSTVLRKIAVWASAGYQTSTEKNIYFREALWILPFGAFRYARLKRELNSEEN